MKYLILTTLVCGAAVALGVDNQPLQRRQTAAKTINTTSGLVSGHAASNASTKTSEYLGIPYAKPPVGDLRFAPPAAYNGISSINGTSFVSPPC
jgi:cholinesterase